MKRRVGSFTKFNPVMFQEQGIGGSIDFPSSFMDLGFGRTLLDVQIRFKIEQDGDDELEKTLGEMACALVLRMALVTWP